MNAKTRDSDSNSVIIIISALLFLVFESAALGFSYWIAYQIESDAISINLAGRQRMLSQRMTKSILQYEVAATTGQSVTETMRAELAESSRLFDETLRAFTVGGEVEAADGRIILQDPVNGKGGQQLIDRANSTWQPWFAAITALLTSDAANRETNVDLAVAAATRANLPLLDYSNRITNHVETTSRQRTRDLRTLQVVAFVLALLNFAILVHSLWRRLYILHGSHEKMREQAETDLLTGLPNRQSLLTRLENAIGEIEFRHTRLVVGFLDLNHFKPVNDRYGHAIGDEVLRETAKRLQRSLRQSDMVARHGGDEFVIILENAGSYDQVSKLLDNLVDNLQAPVQVRQDISVEIGISVGAVAVDSAETTPGEVLQLADQLMYRAKDNSTHHWLLAALVPGNNELTDISGFEIKPVSSNAPSSSRRDH